MKVCCVEGCDATAKQDITYFQFPIKPALRRKWRDAIRLTTKLSPESLVCSQHFTTDDIETARGRVRLKGKVVPSIFHRKDPQSPKEKSPYTNGNTETQNEHTDDKNEHIDAQNERTDDENNVNDNNFIDNYALGNYQNIYEDDDSAEKCTVECVPEAILHQDSDSGSDTELHKEDIEDIIANYHIKQDKKLAERLKASILENQEIIKSDQETKQVHENKNQNNQVSGKDNQVIGNTNKTRASGHKNQQDLLLYVRDEQNSVGNDNENYRRNRDGSKNQVGDNKTKSNVSDAGKDGSDITKHIEYEVEVEFQPSISDEKEPHFVEISVGGGGNREGAPGSPNNDCLMLLENVQVDIDPSLLLDGRDSGPPSPVEDKSQNPISLLTSSDDDDVIIEEPHIDTVEVSDEDEDDVPLNKLVPTDNTKLTKMLWGSLKEYYCFTCGFKTYSHAENARHRLAHSKVIQMCEICKFTTASQAQFIRHKKKHKEDKRFKCHLCDYKARHNMSLVYHLKGHEEGRGNLNPFADIVPLRHIVKKVKRVKCTKCKAGFSNRKDMMKHYKMCKKFTIFKCDSCTYVTKRKSDLKRHKATVHLKNRKRTKNSSEDDDDDDCDPK